MLFVKSNKKGADVEAELGYLVTDSSKVYNESFVIPPESLTKPDEAEHFVLWNAEQPVGKMEWAVYTFIAKGLRKVADLHLDGGEKIKLLPVTFDELVDMATNNHENFTESEVIVKFFEARLDPQKMQELKELFKPLENK